MAGIPNACRPAEPPRSTRGCRRCAATSPAPRASTDSRPTVPLHGPRARGLATPNERRSGLANCAPEKRARTAGLRGTSARVIPGVRGIGGCRSGVGRWVEMHDDRPSRSTELRPAHALRSRRARAGHGGLCDRHHRVRHDGGAAPDRRGRQRLDPIGRPRDLGVRARCRHRGTRARLLRRPVAAPGPADRPDGGVRRLQRRQRPRAQLRGARRDALPRRAPARHLLRRRLARRGEPGTAGPQGPRGGDGDDRALGGQRRRRPCGHVAGPAGRLAVGVPPRGRDGGAHPAAHDRLRPVDPR